MYITSCVQELCCTLSTSREPPPQMCMATWYGLSQDSSGNEGLRRIVLDTASLLKQTRLPIVDCCETTRLTRSARLVTSREFHPGFIVMLRRLRGMGECGSVVR